MSFLGDYFLGDDILWHQMSVHVNLDWVCHRGGCLELYYCNMVESCWWDSTLICKINWFPSVLWHCWFGHM